MAWNPLIEQELAQLRADPRYGIDGADADLVQRELELLIARTCELEARWARQRRARKRRAASLAAASLAAIPAMLSRAIR